MLGKDAGNARLDVLLAAGDAQQPGTLARQLDREGFGKLEIIWIVRHVCSGLGLLDTAEMVEAIYTDRSQL